jgi:hypothetical protein
MTLHDKLKNISLSSLYRDALDLGNHDAKFIALGMAGSLLFELYGRKWMSERILTQDNLVFLTNESCNSLAEPKLQMQILTVGESLYNLRGIEGIQNVLDKLQKDSVESVIAELESGRLFFHRGLSFKFVTRSLKKREDFDIHIFNGSNEIFCETKCKIESTAFSISSFQNSLHKAKQQLPSNYPAIILIKIPHNWGQHEIELRNISKLFVKKSNRPIGVVCWYERWIQPDNTHSIKLTTGFEEHNIKSKIYNSRLIPFLPDEPYTPHWTSFEKYAVGYL